LGRSADLYWTAVFLTALGVRGGDHESDYVYCDEEKDFEIELGGVFRKVLVRVVWT